MRQIWQKYVSWNLLENGGSLLSKTMQTLWKELKFYNILDTPAWRRLIDYSEWRITVVVELSGLGESIICWRRETYPDDILCVLYVMIFHSPYVNLRLFSLPNSMCHRLLHSRVGLLFSAWGSSDCLLLWDGLIMDTGRFVITGEHIFIHCYQLWSNLSNKYLPPQSNLITDIRCGKSVDSNLWVLQFNYLMTLTQLFES